MMDTTQLQTLEYTLLAAAREAWTEARNEPTNKGLLPPYRAAESLDQAAAAVRDWRDSVSARAAMHAQTTA